MTKVFVELLPHPQPSPKMVKFFKRLHYVKFFCCLVKNKIGVGRAADYLPANAFRKTD